MRTSLAILTGKLISVIIKKFKLGGGSAAPGLFALRIDPGLVEGLSKKIPRHVVITGTNGKTTTARMIAHFAKENGLKVIRNHTGSNLERGIASTLISHYSLLTTHYSLGIWELDEAAFNTVAPKLKPDIVVFLNVFRDQLDRYGEVNSVVKGWSHTLKSLPAGRQGLNPQTRILMNGDDTSLKILKKSFRGKIMQFGVKDYKISGESIENQKEKENLDFEAKNVKLSGLAGSSFQLTMNHEPLTINLPLPGIYHIYDALAAIACASLLNLPINRLTEILKTFHPAFGRFEKLPFGYIFLIKNPAGATQVFETIAPQIKKNDKLLFALNDNLADGTDVSWIWDAEWERLQVTGLPAGRQGYRLQAIVSGTRAYDLAVRLKYAGFDRMNIQVEPELEKALKEARKGLKGTLYILPTYTAMLELQGILTKQGIKKEYWREE